MDLLHNNIILPYSRVRIKGVDLRNENVGIFSDEQQILPFKEVDTFPKLHNKIAPNSDNPSSSIFQSNVFSVINFNIRWEGAR